MLSGKFQVHLSFQFVQRSFSALWSSLWSAVFGDFLYSISSCVLELWHHNACLSFQNIFEVCTACASLPSHWHKGDINMFHRCLPLINFDCCLHHLLDWFYETLKFAISHWQSDVTSAARCFNWACKPRPCLKVQSQSEAQTGKGLRSSLKALQARAGVCKVH